MTRPRLFAVLLLAAAGLAAMPAAAVAAQEPAREAPQAGGAQIPLSRVLHELAQHHPGKQLNTTMGQVGGRPAYLVQWQLSNGRVVVFTVDAQTGHVLAQ